MNRFNQMRRIVRRTLINKIRKGTHIKLYKAILMLTHGSEIWSISIRQEAKIENAKNNFRSVATQRRTMQKLLKLGKN
jgi:hypothetical protein